MHADEGKLILGVLYDRRGHAQSCRGRWALAVLTIIASLLPAVVLAKRRRKLWEVFRDEPLF